MSLFHYLNYDQSVPQLGKVTATNTQTTIWHNFGGHSPVAGLTRLQKQVHKTKSLTYPSTNVGIEQEHWQSLSYLPSTAEARSDKITARI